MGILEYIRNGLPKITLGEIIAFGGIFIAACKAIEDLFGKKYLGSWAWGGVKKFFLLPITILHKLEVLSTEVQFVREEVQYNGGKIKLRDIVQKISIQSEINGFKLAELTTRYQIGEECDPTLIFKMDAVGGCSYCNQSFYKYFGFTEIDIKNFNWENLIKKEELTEVQKRWQRAYETKSQFYSRQTILNSEGKEYVCRVIAMPIVLDEKLKGFYGTITPE